MDLLDYIGLGIAAVFGGPELALGLPVTPFMILAGFLLGILVGATPGLAHIYHLKASLLRTTEWAIKVFCYGPFR